jgi:transcriptional regulator with XRE-family HTH domain
MEKSVASKEYRILVALLRAARKSRGVTQVELGKRLEEVQSFVSSIEHGQRRIDMVEAWRWCQALGISFAALAASFEEKVSGQLGGGPSSDDGDMVRQDPL